MEFQATKKSLSQARNAINLYLKQNKTTPINLMTIRAFAKSNKMSFQPYDSLGQRLEYLRLSDRHYILRSFGRDGIQNTNDKNVDQITGVLIKKPEFAYQSLQNSNDFVSGYDGLILAGAESPNSEWYAQVYIDQANATKQLALRSKKNKTTYMIAPHDSIEEFFWLKDSKRIIYTVTSSSLYADGIYIWNVENDQINDVYTGLNQSLDSTNLSFDQNTQRLFLSLASYNKETDEVLAYIHKNYDQQPISIERFLNQNHLYSIKINGNKTKIKQAKIPPNLNYSFNSYWALNKDNSFIGKNGSPSQINWRNLPIRGDFEFVLTNWEEYARKNTGSPVFVYANWSIILIYNDTLRILEAKDPEASSIIRGIAAETAKGLAQNPFAPTYLRALSHYAYIEFIENKILETKVSLVDSTKTF